MSEISDTVHPGKLRHEVLSKPLIDFRSPALVSKRWLGSRPIDPIEQHQFPVDRERGLYLAERMRLLSS